MPEKVAKNGLIMLGQKIDQIQMIAGNLNEGEKWTPLFDLSLAGCII